MIVESIDVEILKTLQGSENVWRGTTTEFAKTLDVSEKVVEDRLRRLEEARSILYYDLNLTP